jgi:hypothetical protein
VIAVIGSGSLLASADPCEDFCINRPDVCFEGTSYCNSDSVCANIYMYEDEVMYSVLSVDDMGFAMPFTCAEAAAQLESPPELKDIRQGASFGSRYEKYLSDEESGDMTSGSASETSSVGSASKRMKRRTDGTSSMPVSGDGEEMSPFKSVIMDEFEFGQDWELVGHTKGDGAALSFDMDVFSDSEQSYLDDLISFYGKEGAPKEARAPQASTPPAVGERGFKNSKNTCYLNAIMQVLTHSKALNKLIRSAGQITTSNDVAGEYLSLWRQMWVINTPSPSSNTPSPSRQLRGSPNLESHNLESHKLETNTLRAQLNAANIGQFPESMLIDAQEALVSIWESLFAVLGAPANGIQNVQRTRCLSCQSSSARSTNEPLVWLPLPSVAGTEDAAVTLEDCFTEFAANDAIPGYECSHCAPISTPAVITHRIESRPEILLVVLRRFNYDETVNTIPVTIPFMMDFSKVPGVQVDGESLYKLTGVVFHQTDGSATPSVHTGHYFAMYMDNNDMWKFANDEYLSVPRVYTDESITSNNAYILMYERI